MRGREVNWHGVIKLKFADEVNIAAILSCRQVVEEERGLGVKPPRKHQYHSLSFGCKCD